MDSNLTPLLSKIIAVPSISASSSLPVTQMGTCFSPPVLIFFFLLFSTLLAPNGIRPVTCLEDQLSY